MYNLKQKLVLEFFFSFFSNQSFYVYTSNGVQGCTLVSTANCVTLNTFLNLLEVYFSHKKHLVSILSCKIQVKGGYESA